MILATIGAAMGMLRTIFFTFWGLFSVVRDQVRITGVELDAEDDDGPGSPRVVSVPEEVQTGRDLRIADKERVIRGSLRRVHRRPKAETSLDGHQSIVTSPRWAYAHHQPKCPRVGHRLRQAHLASDAGRRTNTRGRPALPLR